MRSHWILGGLLGGLTVAFAETGIDGWLRYAPVNPGKSVPHSIHLLGNSSQVVLKTAADELAQGFQQLFNATLATKSSCRASQTIVIGTAEGYRQSCGSYHPPKPLMEDGFHLSITGSSAKVIGDNERGALYGAFQYLSMLSQGNMTEVDYVDNPTQPLRMINQWDNMDGTIERGYGGESIYFANGTVKSDLARVKAYGRLLASIRISTLIVNNVNANETLLLPNNIMGLGRIANELRPYGIQIGISINFASPMLLGELNTFDPLDPSVVAWWSNVTRQLYDSVPDMTGFVVKANSEGQPGPLTYNRTLAEGANLFAKALQPHEGIVLFRAFIYTAQNYSDWKADRAKQAVEYIAPLDGHFDDNVVIQIKYGAIDFQPIEPASPLFANLRNTSMLLELEVSQEYTGQQSHFVYLPPLWRTILDFDTRLDGKKSLVSDLASGKRTDRPLGGVTAVANVGMNATWLGSDLAMANLYASGRLAWDATQASDSLFEDWARLTFTTDENFVSTTTNMAMDSWQAFINYTNVLGLISPTDGGTHYGLNPASDDGPSGSRWVRAYAGSIGMDRTVYNGTGYSGQYPPQAASMFESVKDTPEYLLLYLHHLPFNHTLKSGETIIQYIYNAHYNGADRAGRFTSQWYGLRNLIDYQRYQAVQYQLDYQSGSASVFRDAMVNWFYNLTQIPDDLGRVGHPMHRIEAESMTLDGYQTYLVNPFEAASNNTAVVTTSNTTAGMVSTALDQVGSGMYDLAINYYDLSGTRSNWTVYLDNQTVATFVGDREDHLGHAPSTAVDTTTATRRTYMCVYVQKGAMLKIVGQPALLDLAPLDYITLTPSGGTSN